MSNKKAQAFLQKKKEAVKSKMQQRKERGGEGRDTSKMPEGLRKRFEAKQERRGQQPEGGQQQRRQRPEGQGQGQGGGRGGQMPPQRRRQMAQARRRRQG